MKKLIFVLLSILLLTSCSGKKQEQPRLPVSVTQEKPKESVANDKNQIPRNMDDEEVLEELKGIYLSCDYIDKFKDTKSAVDSKSCFAAMIVNDEEGKFGVMQLDGHQGSDRSYVKNIEYDGNGSYIVSFIADIRNDKSFDIDLKYTPGNSRIQCSVKTVAVMWENSNKVIDFYKYNDIEDVYYELGACVFDGYTSTFVEKDRVGFEYEEEVYTVQVSFDIVEDTPLNLDDADGFLFMTKESTGEKLYGKYACDDVVLRIFDGNGNVFAEFRKPKI